MNTNLIQPNLADESSTTIKALPILPAIGIFLGLGILFRFFIYSGIPLLQSFGLHPFEAFLIMFNLPLLILFVLAFIMLKQEGVPMTLAALSRRFRLYRFGWRPILLTFGIYILSITLSLALAPTRGWILDLSPLLGPNESFPTLLNPVVQNENIVESALTWMGPNAAGNWRWASLVSTLFFLNMFGEELLWRGVILPRQELIYGRWAWLVHGILWLLFHLPFYPWYLIFGLPSTLGLSFLAQKTQNTWPPLIIHTMFNATIYLIMLLITLGVIQ